MGCTLYMEVAGADPGGGGGEGKTLRACARMRRVLVLKGTQHAAWWSYGSIFFKMN